jgi:ribonuclease Z
LVIPADPARSYAYCSDTRYIPTLHQLLCGVDTIYHESTYTSDYEDRARLYYHSTSKQAASVARDAGAKQLLLGHYSARYIDESKILAEAKDIFPNSKLTDEGKIFDV